MNRSRERRWRILRALGVGVLVFAVAGSAAWMATGAPKSRAPAAAPKLNSETADTLRQIGPDGVAVPADLAARMGLRTATAAAPTRGRTLTLRANLAFDPSRLARIQSPCPGQVVAHFTRDGQEILSVTDRPVMVADQVESKQPLAVIWSKDLADKKSELLDAVSKLRRDQYVLSALSDPNRSSAISPVSVRNAQRDVDADWVMIRRADVTLRGWGVSKTEIDAIWAEVDRQKLADETSATPDHAAWARVEIRSPIRGVLVEKNVTGREVVDTATTLFQVADMSRLAVWAHLREEDVPLVQTLLRRAKATGKPLAWLVELPSGSGSLRGVVDTVAPTINAAQRTALVSGTVENPRGELKDGMSVTVTIELPPPPGEVQLPAEAVVEDGRESVVFVQPNPAEWVLVRRHVRVVRRYADVVCLADEPGSIRPGDRVLTSGSLLLRGALTDLPPP